MIPALFVLAGLLAPAGSLGQEAPEVSENGPAFFRPLSRVGTDPAKWGLDGDDWRQYQSLMQGEAGLYYAHLEPSWVLAMYEQETSRRERYLTLAVQRDRHRNRRLLDFNRAFIRVRDRLFPGDAVIDENLFQSRMAVLGKPPASAVHPGRVRAWVNVFDCVQCVDRIRHLVRAGRPVDIFFLDARSESDIQQWARRMALPVDQVNSGRITLNFDDGAYRRFNTRTVPWIVEE
ncbi:MAG: TIGR03759 family integrating conjugative element protein [Gammaproteobacteria bacterium]|nr:TIGR03759 family integrating conjugative element protein [Gammaproteobacteria bacterium]